MNLCLEYFLLYQGLNLEVEQLDNFEINATQDLEAVCLILVCKRDNFNKFLSLESFKNLLKIFSKKETKELSDIYKIQISILKELEKNIDLKDLKQIQTCLEKLKKAKILTRNDYEKLLSLFQFSNFSSSSNLSSFSNLPKLSNLDNPEPENTSKNTIEEESSILVSKNSLEFGQDYKQIKKTFLALLEDAKACLDKVFLPELENLKNFLEKQKFSIGVTGVMNAGKSTMLNALLKEEILGTSVVPETANLSILKYGKKAEAKVFFWNIKEWNKIKQSAKELKNMQDFVKQSEANFSQDFPKLIQEISHTQTISLKDLKFFTSAKDSKGKCNLVKYVEIFSSLSFLKDGIEIVDTPGLDDPIIQREEITKNYMNKCDLMIHLMNVSQSASLKDIDFIIDSLLYQNISKLLIVITRIDSVSKEQVEEVISYTKNSLETRLQTLGKNSKLKYILEHIEFLPISAQSAIYYRTKQEDKIKDLGLSLEQSGISKLEVYLKNTLFGKNSQRKEIIFNSAKSSLARLSQKGIQYLEFTKSLGSKNKKELENDLKILEDKISKSEENFNILKKDLDYYKQEINSYLEYLKDFLAKELLDLRVLIKQRILDDVSYELEKNKKKPKQARINIILQTGLKDGIIDIIRDFRYKFIKKFQDSIEVFERKYQNLELKLQYQNDTFNARTFFQNDFKNAFTSKNNDALEQKINQAIKEADKNKLDLLDAKILDLLKQNFLELELELSQRTKELSSEMIKKFFNILNIPLNEARQELKNDEDILKSSLININKSSEEKAQNEERINKNLKSLNSILKVCL